MARENARASMSREFVRATEITETTKVGELGITTIFTFFFYFELQNINKQEA